MSVLLVDTLSDQKLLAALLRRAGYTPIETADSSEAIRELMDVNPQLIIAAQESPPIDGVEFLPLIRRLTEVPIIVIGPDSEDAMVQALFQGADAYIKRPINPDDLLARLRTLLRRWNARKLPREEGRNFNFKDVADLNTSLKNLTRVEAKLLKCLLDKRNGMASREELMLGVWGQRSKSSSLRFYIKQLRQKLYELQLGEILNFRGRGYRLVLTSSDTTA